MEYIVVYTVGGTDLVYHHEFKNIKFNNGEIGTICKHRDNPIESKKYVRFGSAKNTADRIKKEIGGNPVVAIFNEEENTVYFETKTA